MATAQISPIAESATPSPDEIRERARAMLPDILARAARCEAEHKVPDETIAELKAAGMFKITQPKRYGGYEMNPNVLFDVQMTLAEACMSTAWVYGLLAVHQFQLGLFDDRCQQEAWSEDPDTLIASTYQPVGKVTRVEGGFRLSGHWGFSSGVQHAGWIFLGSAAPPLVEGGPPVMTTFLLPKGDYRYVEGTWDTFGLQGTGSLDVIVEDAFIPAYRTHTLQEGFEVVHQPGLKVNTGPLFRMPWGQQFSRSVSTAAIGALQGALDTFLQIAGNRVSTNTGKATKNDPQAQAYAAMVQSEILAMKTTLHRNFDEMMAWLEAGQDIPLTDRVRYRYEAAQVARKCSALVDGFLPLLGGRAIYNSSPILRYWRDILASRAHVANNPDPLGASLGAVYMGQPNVELFV
ncbi:acyl-CoA dehydrogenase family protein [Flavisphingomonas formosensis]|uniref:acyl-CoA dehydrogenase family protein n=1 Tax=Flavisphingomonas formosensis TaxID=861534 RepID=UPI0012FCE227|nr:acyl-CoA dehydrogenase family protein [Sphingomonas formosensis]